MTDDTTRRTTNRDAAADSGTPGGGTFESVDWTDIDHEDREWAAKELVFGGLVLVWLVGATVDVYQQFVVEEGPAEFPLLGTVDPVDWLWSITLLIILYYGVLPLYENRRMAGYYWKEFRKNKAAVISAIYLVVIFLIGIVGTRIVPAPEPTPGLDNQPPAWGSVETYVTGTRCPGGTTEIDGIEHCLGSWEHPFGTTPSGEDLFRGVVHGMEVSMQVGLIATLISIGIAASIALTAAYYGGLIDDALFRYVDIQMTFPTFFLYLLLAYTIGGSLFVLIMIFGLFGWGGYARIMRAEALQRREEAYMLAAKSAGASSRWSIRRHLLPNISNSVITAASLAIPSIILAEAAIAFLGLGDPTLPSWGRLIADGRGRLANAWWISTIPGIFLFLTVLAFNFLGDALRDALDPRHGGSGE